MVKGIDGTFTKQAKFVAMLHVILARADCTCCLASRYCSGSGKVVPLASWVAVLLEMGEVLYDDALLLCSHWSAACHLHQIQNTLAVLCLSFVNLFLVLFALPLLVLRRRQE